MLDEYFHGTLPQLIERARLLKTKVPRTLPRDYGALIGICESELDSIISSLRALQQTPARNTQAVHDARLRQFKRAVADLDLIETRGIAVLSRAQGDDHHANRLVHQICQEIRHPIAAPTVTTLSTEYFYIDTKLNLMFIPPAEGSFLLHLPDLYHELAHPLLTRKDHPVLDRFRTKYLRCVEAVHDYFAGERDKHARRRAPSGFKFQADLWEHLWSKYWLTELFCDLYAAATLGPAFAWSHLHLFLKRGGDAFWLPDGMRLGTHPADDARMRAILHALSRLGFAQEAGKVESRWHDALRLTTAGRPEPDYIHCYPDALVDVVVEEAMQGVRDMDCRIPTHETQDPVHLMLNQAWLSFWAEPNRYHEWEAAAAQTLLAFCDCRVSAEQMAALTSGEVARQR